MYCLIDIILFIIHIIFIIFNIIIIIRIIISIILKKKHEYYFIYIILFKFNFLDSIMCFKLKKFLINKIIFTKKKKIY